MIGIIVTFIANCMDVFEDEISDTCRILYVLSLLFALVKVLFLIRVSKKMSFLVMMIINVIIEIKYFMVLFFIFILIFAQCFHLVSLDHATYGRIPELLALSIACLRSAMGDFAIFDMRYGFDLMDSYTDENGELLYKHRLSYEIILFTIFIYLLVAFFLFMIFMNFIIAVISQSYSKITAYSVAHDYC